MKLIAKGLYSIALDWAHKEILLPVNINRVGTRVFLSTYAGYLRGHTWTELHRAKYNLKRILNENYR